MAMQEPDGLLAAGGDLRVANVLQHHIHAGKRADMGDSAAHLSGADNANALNVPHSPGTIP